MTRQKKTNSIVKQLEDLGYKRIFTETKFRTHGVWKFDYVEETYELTKNPIIFGFEVAGLHKTVILYYTENYEKRDIEDLEEDPSFEFKKLSKDKAITKLSNQIEALKDIKGDLDIGERHRLGSIGSIIHSLEIVLKSLEPEPINTEGIVRYFGNPEIYNREYLGKFDDNNDKRFICNGHIIKSR